MLSHSGLLAIVKMRFYCKKIERAVGETGAKSDPHYFKGRRSLLHPQKKGRDFSTPSPNWPRSPASAPLFQAEQEKLSISRLVEIVVADDDQTLRPVRQAGAEGHPFQVVQGDAEVG